MAPADAVASTGTMVAFGAWLAIFAGMWFVVGPAVSLAWERSPGPIGSLLCGSIRQMLELLGYFYLLGCSSPSARWPPPPARPSTNPAGPASADGVSCQSPIAACEPGVDAPR